MKKKLIFLVLVISIVFFSGCVQQNEAESIVSANQAEIKADLQASGLDMNTNELYANYVNETSWKVMIYEGCKTETCPITYCVVYATVSKNTKEIENLEFEFGCQELSVKTKCSNFKCTGYLTKE